MGKNILDLHPDELKELLTGSGIRKYRAGQLLSWLYGKYESDFDRMTDLPLGFRESLKKDFELHYPRIVEERHSADKSVKYLLELSDRNLIEMVVMPNPGKNTLCLSSQVGCRRRCSFCATGSLGFTRNLQVNEIIAQVLLARKKLSPASLTNLVFMGMGEPMDNLDNVIKAIRIMQHQEGMSFSPRRITVSTCGIIPGIKLLTTSGLKVKLAVSLNSAIQEKREKLMPVAARNTLTDLKSALVEFRSRNPYRITFEYVLIGEYNMSDRDIKALRAFLGDISCKLNLIRYNRIDVDGFSVPDEREIRKFIDRLKDMKLAVTLRDSRGEDIEAACGQLAGRRK